MTHRGVAADLRRGTLLKDPTMDGFRYLAGIMSPQSQRFSVPDTDRQRFPLVRWRIFAIALALAGLAVVSLYSDSLAVSLGAAALVGGGLYFVTGSTDDSRPGVARRIVEEHKLLVESIESAPIPFAVYDQDDYLVVCNESYERLYGDVFDTLRSRTLSRRIHYADLVRGFSANSVPTDELDAYVAERCRAQRNADGTGVDRHYPGFGWLRVTKFATPAGAVAGFAVDINELKQRETALNAQIEKSKSLESKLRELANTDPLTELPNRRSFFERLEAEFTRANRYDNSLSVVMMDIDNFKSINDVHGHSFGDDVITRLASTAAAGVRTHVDLVARLGGEEFAVLLPVTGVDGACECAQRICKSIAALEFDAGGAKLQVTASFGVATALPEDRSYSECMTRADSALYRAKAEGRNRVVIWDGAGD